MSSTVRTLTYFIFVYTCVEGLVVNMLYPWTGAFIIKDGFILLLYLVMMTENRPKSGALARLSAPLTVFALMNFFYLMMPSPVGVLGEAVALKQRLFYVPLCFAGYHFARNEDDIKGLMKVMAWSAIPTSLFGIYLYFGGPAALQAIGGNYAAVFYSTAGEHQISFYRVPGTFTSPGQFGMYLLANGILFTGVLFMTTLDKKQRLLTIVAAFCVLGALMVSGSRTPLLALLMCGAVILVLMGKIAGLGTWAVGLYSMLTIGFAAFGDGVKDRVGSIASYDHVERFQTTYFGQLFMPYLQQAPLGHGLGIATIGARHFAPENTVFLVESYFGILAMELGIFGVLAFFYLAVAIALMLIGGRKAMAHSPTRSIWYASSILVLFITMFTPVNTSMDSAPGNMYYWFFLGVSARLFDIERERRVSQRAAAAAIPASPPYGTFGQFA